MTSLLRPRLPIATASMNDTMPSPSASFRSAKRRRPTSRFRSGAVLIELAVCLPVLTLIVLASIEAAALTFARQAMVQTAYEAAVVAVRREATNAQALAAAQAVTNGRLLAGVTVRFNPTDVSQVPRGELITVTAEIPAAAARRLGSRLLNVNNISASATMVKE